MTLAEKAPKQEIADTQHLQTKPELAMHAPFKNISKAVVEVGTNREVFNKAADADLVAQMQGNAKKSGLELGKLAENLRDAMSAIKPA